MDFKTSLSMEPESYEEWLLRTNFSREDQETVAASIIINAIDNAYDSLGPGREERNVEIICETLESAHNAWSVLWSKHPDQIDYFIFETICKELIGEYPKWQSWRSLKNLN